MFTKSKKSTLASEFKCIYGKYKYYDGEIYVKIGEGRDEEKGEDVVFVIDPDQNLKILEKDYFEGKLLLLSRGYVKRFEPTI